MGRLDLPDPPRDEDSPDYEIGSEAWEEAQIAKGLSPDEIDRG